ncbi:thymidine kinase [Parafilimonas sp.]|uniref:thymidine kinase n=1 Tax=Parafilimonas sp. TaxID=1969739 RepID=UPI0039E2A64B
MFIEPHIKGEKRGWIEVICGSMFSGKTEELIRRLKRARIAHLKAEIFKPAIDTRYDINNVVSHDETTLTAQPVQHSQNILLLADDADVVAIDEVQFFDSGIVSVCEQLALAGIRVIVAGLDMDFKGKPFGPVPQLLATADYITKLHAICVHCGNIASRSYRKTKQSGQVVLGELDVYEPRCRVCYEKGDAV